ncbi:sugar transferase [Spirobacillus cienkowskii]|uniref:sugar transferase n=1 Tax=Spirobacillus cienkowskii TaxID=495820 RepID=UPI0030D61ADA
MIHVKHIKRRKTFVLIDIACVCLSIYLAFFIRTNIYLPIFQDLLPLSALSQNINFLLATFTFSLVFLFSGYIIGLYDIWNTSNISVWANKLLVPNFFIVSFAFSFLYLSQNFSFPRSYLVTLFVVNFFLSLAWRIIYFKITNKEISNVVLVGDYESCMQFSKEFSKEPFLNKIKVCSIFINNSFNISDNNTIPIKNINEFESYSQHHPYSSIIIVSTTSLQYNFFAEIFKAARQGVQVFTVPNHYEILLGRLKHIHVNDLPLLELKLDSSISFYTIIKRTFDIILSLVSIIILITPMLLVALLIKLTSQGPIFYTQTRVGKNSEKFKIIKFRSMIHNAEQHTGAILALKNDERITKFGNFMRKTRIDELPQLINILKGDMSFIGPRPERPNFVEQFEKEIPAYAERTRIRPGVTGLAQIHGDYNSSADTKLKYDLAYLVNQSLFLDIQILIKTIKVVMMKKGQ